MFLSFSSSMLTPPSSIIKKSSSFDIGDMLLDACICPRVAGTKARLRRFLSQSSMSFSSLQLSPSPPLPLQPSLRIRLLFNVIAFNRNESRRNESSKAFRCFLDLLVFDDSLFKSPSFFSLQFDVFPEEKKKKKNIYD